MTYSFSIRVGVLFLALLTSVEAQPLRLSAIAYPRVAQLARVQGEMEVVCKAAADGKVTDVQTIVGHPLLARTVVESVRNWRFKPVGRQIEHKLVVKFRLSGNCRGDVCREEFWFEYPDLIEVTGQHPQLNPGPLRIERD